MEEIIAFLNELRETPASEDIIHPKIVGNYCLNTEDAHLQIMDWVIHYMESRNCPYHLAIEISRRTAQEVIGNVTNGQENSNEEKVLNSISLYMETMKKVPFVCNAFLDSISETNLFSSSCSLPFSASVYAIRNKRRKMEDRHVIHHDLNALLELKDMPFHSYYAVFDGHSGVDAASYAAAHLHVNIARHPTFLSDTKKAITEAFKITDENFLKKCYEENIKAGATAISALVKPKQLYLAWLGDSQAVLVKNGKAVIVTDPHKPDREDEQKRIEDVGGDVTYETGIARVNGILAVTRAIGDPDHKRFIIGDPTVTEVVLDGDEDFLILACDGLWDGMSPDEVTLALYQNLLENDVKEPSESIAAKLVHQSKLQGSEDNITVIVVFLRDIASIKEYASKHLPQCGSQPHFHEMNGLGKVPACDLKLEFNSDLMVNCKKLKNAANVLSSTGISDPTYVCSVSGRDLEGVTFQNVNIGGDLSGMSPIAAAGLAPEATALSELPTPPIDDVVASQQFEQLSIGANQSFDSTFSTEVHDFDISDLNSKFVGLSVKSSTSSVSSACVEQKLISTSDMEAHDTENSYSALSPEEAVDIASSVVSNTIETAVKCLSGEATSSKAAAIEEQPPAIPVSSPKPPPVSPPGLNPYAVPFIPDKFQSELPSTTNDVAGSIQPAVEDALNVSLERSEQEAVNQVKEISSMTEVSKEQLCSEDIMNFEAEIKLFDEPHLEKFSKSEINKVDISSYEKVAVNQSKTDDSRMNEECAQSVLNAGVSDVLDILSGINVEAKESALQDSHFKSFDPLGLPASELNVSKIAGFSEIANAVNPNLDSQEALAPKVDEKLLDLTVTEQKVTDVCTKEGSATIESASQPDSTTLLLENIISNSPDAVIATSDLASSEVLPPDVPEDGPVNLHKIPDGIPEADCVTEDVDSDSEKDGGWSYMKGNTVGASGKTKSAQRIGATSTPLKTKKDSAKPLLDNKSKMKSSTLIDKTRKPLEKKIPDVREKTKPKLPSSTLPKTQVEKVPMASKLKKDLPSANIRASSATSTKPLRTAANIKPITERSVASASRPVQAPLSSKPKSAVTANGLTRPSTRPSALSAPASKGPSTNQSNKSNEATTARAAAPLRTATSTVPSKTLSKLSAPKPTASEPKLKTVSTTVRKAAPLTTLRKPVVKETKEIVNNEISARRNVVNKSDGTGRATAAATSRLTSTVSRGDTVKRATTLMKTDGVKSSATANKITLPSNKPPPAKTNTFPLRKGVAQKGIPSKATPTRLATKNSIPSKVSQQVAAKGEEKKTQEIDQKETEEKASSAAGYDKVTPEITPEAEKFSLEVNDKEIEIKEHNEILHNVDLISPNVDEKQLASEVISNEIPLDASPLDNMTTDNAL